MSITTPFINFKDMGDDDWRRFLVTMDACEALQLARSPYCPAIAYRDLCEYPDTEVRAAMARRNGSEAGFITRKLMHDKEFAVLEGIACNHAADQMALTILTRHSNSYISQMAAENPRTPGDAVDEFYMRVATKR